MRLLLNILLSVALTLPLLAAPGGRTFKPGGSAKAAQLPSDPGRVTRLVRQYLAAMSETSRDGSLPGTAAIADPRSARLLLLPAAGNVRGAGGEFFRSDVTLVSYKTDAHQHLAAVWLQNGVNTDDPPTVELTLDANTYYTFTDFVGTILKRENQLGSILLVPVDDAGEIDITAAVDGYSRIWTNQPNANGTVAQPFEAVDPFSFQIFDTASVMGLRHDSQYRSNYGVVNIDDVPHTFQVHFMGESAVTSTTVTIPAGGMIHQAVPAGNYGSLVIEVTADDPQAPWVAYGTSNDNITGDGWVSIGSGILTPEDLDDIEDGF